MPNPHRFLLFFSIFFAATSGAVAQELSDEESRIRDYVQGHTEEAIAFLEQVVNVGSGTMNPDGVREVGRLFKEHYDAIGFETRWISFPEEVNRAGHLFAERKGDRGKRLVLIGHIDTVFERDSTFQTFERSGDTAAGPGVADMKGGDVVMLFALKALHHVGALDGTTMTVALIGDEEKPGRPISLVRGDLIEAAKNSDVALGFEGAVGRQNATVARRGASRWTLKTTGKRGHSGQIFSETYGSGAIFEVARILNAFHEDVRGEQYLTFNAGVIVGGTTIEYDPETARGTAFGKTNVIPQAVTVQGGLRFISEEQKEKAREKMRAVASKNLPGTSADISFGDGYPAMEPKEGNYKLMEMLDDVSRALGHGPITPLDPSARGAADISFVASLVDALSGLGPVGKGAHSVEEDLDLTTLPVATARAAVLIYRLTR
jgi:glutamate carboxypeptidase